MKDKVELGEKTLVTVVDDMVGNLKIVGKILLNAGFEVSMIQDSKKALTMLLKKPPDLILLDIMMPFVDGYQLCEQIKKEDILKEIPVIFLTAKSETSDLVKGFEVGGVDYIVKPANKEELLVRINTQLELKLSKDLIINQKNEIKQLFIEKNKFMDVAIQSIKEPLERIVEKSQYIQRMKEMISDKEYDEQLDWIVKDSKVSFQTISDLYDVNYLDINSESEDIEISSFSLEDLTKDILVDYETDIKKKRLILKCNEKDEEEVDFGSDVDETIIKSNKSDVRQIIDNYISNAIKYTPFYKHINISIKSGFENDEQIVIFEIKDEGPGISNEDQKKLFQKFVKLNIPTTGKEPSSGLGLFIVKKLSERINVKIGVKSFASQGSTFFAIFPKDIKEDINAD